MSTPIAILIADDEEIVRRVVRAALKAVDAVFLEAKDATEALKIAREHSGPIDLLVSDVMMPGTTTGIELAARLCHARPEMKVVVMSGYAPDLLTIRPEWTFIKKPFGASEIREIVGNVLTDHYCVPA
jgi:two-component system cell cycle sensor histidine kinase/response regulator CckA